MTRIPPASSTSKPRYTETKFQADVVKLARDLGWGITHQAAKKLAEEAAGWGQAAPALDGLIFHPRIMYRSEPGWPDLTLVRRRDRRLIFAELKAEDGKLTPRQREVLELLQCLETPAAVVSHAKTAADAQAMALFVDGLRGARIQVFVWRPSDMPKIHEVLA
jgi:hypothetical protein